LLLREVKLISGRGDLAEKRKKSLTPLIERDFDGGWREDAHALAWGEFDEAVALEERIGLGDGHGIDLESLCEGANGGQKFARLETFGGNQRADLVDELTIDRNAGGGRDGNKKGRVHAY